MCNLAIFANFQIDSEERLLRLKDSYRSFCNADIENWVVNIRGKYKYQAGVYLKNELKE